MQRILLVDCNKSFQFYFKDMLYEVDSHLSMQSVTDPKRALVIAKEFSPDIIFIDSNLPLITCSQLSAIFKNHEDFSHIPIIVLATSENDSNLIHALETDADDFLIKEGNLKISMMRLKGILKLIGRTQSLKIEALELIKKEQQKMALISRLDIIGKVTSQVVHDFSNHVMIVNAKTIALNRILKTDAELKLTSDIRKTTMRTQKLIKNILTLTRTSESLALIDPFTYLKESQDLLKMVIGNSIAINIESDGLEGLIEVGPSSFDNAIINLCVNAKEAMPDRGEIVISVKQTEKNQNKYVAISVRDTGHGIPLDLQRKIFQPFFTTKKSGMGCGLGLSQFSDFVKMHKGFVTVDSDSEGTSLTMFLPNMAS